MTEQQQSNIERAIQLANRIADRSSLHLTLYSKGVPLSLDSYLRGAIEDAIARIPISGDDKLVLADTIDCTEYALATQVAEQCKQEAGI